MSSERLTELEIKYAHMEDFVHKLNTVVVEQAAIIGRLEKDMLDLKRNANLEDGVQPSRSLQDDKPPHY
jgi:uncharacterized coiled-coil protein SlyX